MTGWAASWLRYFQLVRLAGLAMRSVQRIREQVYGHVLRLPMRFFDRAITGQLVSRVTNDTEAVKKLYMQVLFVMLVRLIVLFGVVAGDAVAGLAADADRGAAGAGECRRSSGSTSGCRPAVTRSRELRSDINAQMAESIAGMSVLQASGAVDRFAARFARTNEAHYEARRRAARQRVAAAAGARPPERPAAS